MVVFASEEASDVTSVLVILHGDVVSDHLEEVTPSWDDDGGDSRCVIEARGS